MSDINNASTPAKEETAKTVIDDMASRRLFDSTEEAGSYILKCQQDFADFGNYPAIFVGSTEDGNFDPEIYTEDMRVAVAVLTQRGEGKNSSTVKAIVIYPSPKVHAILGIAPDAIPTGQGFDWLSGIIEKELNHVAVRQLRKAENEDDLANAMESMPKTIGEYITSNRETSSGILETYNQLWQIIKKGMAAKFKSFSLANLSKKELRKAMESSSYAATVYPNLERKGSEKGSLFETAINFGLALAKKEGLDPAIFDRMNETRLEKEISAVEDEEEGDFDFEAMAAELTKKEEAATPAEEGTEPAPDQDGAAA